MVKCTLIFKILSLAEISKKIIAWVVTTLAYEIQTLKITTELLFIYLLIKLVHYCLQNMVVK